MTKAVNLYLVSGVSNGNGFWLINFTEEDDIFMSFGNNLLECYRKELFGLDAAIEVRWAINTTLDILCFNLKLDRYKLDNLNTGYSSEIPINVMEDIFDLWAYNYNNEIRWKKYIGLLNFRKKLKTNNNYINIGLKGDSYKFAMKLDKLLSFKSTNFSLGQNKSNDLMW